MVIILGITKLHTTIILRYVVYTPGQKSFRHLTKCQLVTHYFEVGSHCIF